MANDPLIVHKDIEVRQTEGHKHLVIFPFLALTLLLATLDNQIVATAMPTIVGDLGAAQHLSWLISAYILSQCAVIPIYGKLGDLFGRKYVTVAALGLFTLGSILCAGSWSMESLIVARVVQGLGAGGLLVSVFAICADLFEPARRAKFQSYLSFTLVFGSCIGPTLGGFLTEAFGWRSIFLVTAPIGVVSIIGILKFLPLKISERQPVIDYAGALMLALTVAMLVVWGGSVNVFGSFGSAQSVALGIAAVSAGAAWVLVERRAKEPIIPLQLLAQRNFLLLAIATMCSGAVALGLVNYYAYFLQMVVGLSPMQAGLYFIALTIGVSMGALVSGRLMSRGVDFVTPLRVSLVLSGITLSIFSFLPQNASTAELSLAFIIQGGAVGLSMNASVLGAQVTATERDVGAATSAISLARMIGAAFGIAIYGSIMATGLSGVGLPENEGLVGMTPEVLHELPPKLYTLVVSSFASSFSILFQVAAAMAIFGFFTTLFIRRTDY